MLCQYGSFVIRNSIVDVKQNVWAVWIDYLHPSIVPGRRNYLNPAAVFVYISALIVSHSSQKIFTQADLCSFVVNIAVILVHVKSIENRYY